MANSTSIRSYLFVFVALMALLAVSVAVVYVDLGRWNLVLALAISTAKATLVIVYFMHLLESRRLVPVFAGAGLLWLAFLLVLTFADYTTRLEPTAESSPDPAEASVADCPRPRGSDSA